MEVCLTSEEVRVLGCLLEKMMATPEYYPLSLNALVNACNQKVNRHPVVAYDEATVLGAVESLRHKKLLWANTS
ncbi:MAG: YceH family protein, partial [Phycisphaerae bacterium]|nr:YceH family protein [Phycisphaerae bacterium]